MKKLLIIALLSTGMVVGCKKEFSGEKVADEKINPATTAVYTFPGGQSYITCNSPGNCGGNGWQCMYFLDRWGSYGGSAWFCNEPKDYRRDWEDPQPLNKSVIDSAEIDSVLWDDLVDSRDNYLHNFEAGKELIVIADMFDQVSKQNGTPVVGLAREAAFGWQTKLRLNLLKSGSLSSVLVDSAYRAEGIYIIGQYKLAYPEPVFERACDKAITLLNRFNGQTVSDYYSWYNNNTDTTFITPYNTRDLLPIVP